MELKIGYATLETKAFKLLEGKINEPFKKQKYKILDNTNDNINNSDKHGHNNTNI